jgi:hypothetical protein
MRLRNLTVQDLEKVGITEDFCDKCGEVFPLSHFAHFIGEIIQWQDGPGFIGHACCDPKCRWPEGVFEKEAEE